MTGSCRPSGSCLRCEEGCVIKKTILASSAILVVLVVAMTIVPIIIAKPGGSSPSCGWQAKNDIDNLSAALDLYRLDNSIYPSKEQGLKALIEKPNSEPLAKNWRKHGYIKSLTPDPWGQQYLYDFDGEHYRIVSLGEDGRIGGRGCNRDRSNQEIF